MTHRTTFALDEATADRLKRLAAHWRVSQAEVVRRAVLHAEEQSTPAKPDPVAMLQELFAAGQGLGLDQAGAYIETVYRDREHWRGQ